MSAAQSGDRRARHLGAASPDDTGAGDRSEGLVVEGLSAGYGAVAVVEGVDLAVRPGELVGLIGRNGAGKTTTLRAIAGTLRPTAGRVHLSGRQLDGLPAARVASEGLGLVAAGHRVFREMTVGENLRVGAFVRRRSGDDLAEGARAVCALFPTLAGRMNQVSGQLSGGEQQMVAIAQALLGKPSVLLLDEPSFGLAPAVVDAIYRVLRQLAGDGIGILLVEQEVERALQSCDRVLLMESGRIARSSMAAQLNADEVARIMVGRRGDERSDDRFRPPQ